MRARRAVSWTPARRVFDYCYPRIIPGRHNAFWGTK